ncbi:hypothetical protein [Photobacterium sp. J15]|uniref:hypothetical protein n=1 Tax=Photobacterium sp. J15 TaxID=265901 RepID=UPI0007E49849|nr:hypothetical protein [Photobacterium sp. J15]
MAVSRPLLILISLSYVTIAQASSPEAWDEFEDRLKAACSRLFDSEYSHYQIHTDPFGSEHFGFAIANGKLRLSSGLRAPKSLMVCVYDKQSHTAELSRSFKTSQFGQ